MKVRVPAILDGVIAQNPGYSAATRQRVRELAEALRDDQPLPQLGAGAPDGARWARALTARRDERWLQTDWLFAETYAYRQLVERVGFWDSGQDPFLPTKREEYATPAHAQLFRQALALEGGASERLHALFGAALFANRMDLSFAASRSRGTNATPDDLLTDDRASAVRIVTAGVGSLHVVCDNAGSELTLDLVLTEHLLRTPGASVTLHVKRHPTFVSDATQRDVLSFLMGSPAGVELALGEAEADCLARLRDALGSRRLTIAEHDFWNGPESLWELPEDLEQVFRGARLVVLKGDANYRRALGDALWSPEASFAELTAYFPAPLFALRTLKSDPIVGLEPGRAQRLDQLDPAWRVNGQRGVASLGGAPDAKT